MITDRTAVTPRNGNEIAHRSHTQSRSGGTYVATDLPVADWQVCLFGG
jgi:hypothetical protein